MYNVIYYIKYITVIIIYGVTIAGDEYGVHSSFLISGITKLEYTKQAADEWSYIIYKITSCCFNQKDIFKRRFIELSSLFLIFFLIHCDISDFLSNLYPLADQNLLRQCSTRMDGLGNNFGARK